MELAGKILTELKITLGGLSEAKLKSLVKAILTSQKIFVAGAGRSGLMTKAFAMRLMHMGFTAYVVGEIITPGIRPDDLLIIGSGSGSTESLTVMAEKAKSFGARIALISIIKDSRIGKLADLVITIPAPTPKLNNEHGFTSIQPMGSLFEQSLLLTLDMIIMLLMVESNKDSAMMFQRHANLE
jgi:6-phospho-3-hexuloisomerase